MGSFSPWSQNSILTRTILWYELWCCVSILPPEAGHPPYIASRLRKPAYGMNDAPRRWWNILDKARCSSGMVLTRADRCCYVFFSMNSREQTWNQGDYSQCKNKDNISIKPSDRIEADGAYDRILNPIAGSPATGKNVAGTINLFVDDLFETDGTEIEQRVLARPRKDFSSWLWRLEWCDIYRTKNSLDERFSIRIAHWGKPPKGHWWIERYSVEGNTKESLHCTPAMHTRKRSLLGQINWLQSRTQFQWCYKFSRCASMAASPTIGDVKALNKLARQLMSPPVKLQFWPLTGPLRIIGFPDASYRNNEDGFCTKKHGSVLIRITWAINKGRNVIWKFDWFWKPMDKKRAVLSPTCGWAFLLHEVFWFMPVSPRIVDGPIWPSCKKSTWEADAREPGKQQQEQFMYLNKRRQFTWISMLRKEACSGSTHDLAHISTQNCLAGCLTKASAKADNLVTAAKTGKLSEVDIHPNFRTLMEHKAFLSTWCKTFMHTTEKDVFFLNTLKVSLAPTPQEGPFHVMFVRKQHTQEPKEPRDYDWN